MTSLTISMSDIHEYDSTLERADSKRVKFSKEEDDILQHQVAIYGARKWNQIALALPGRTSRQCRDRFMNYLNDSLTNGPWTVEEDKALEKLYIKFGPQWSLIRTYFTGRSANNIKNRWNTHFSHKIRTYWTKKQSKHSHEYRSISQERNRKVFPSLCPLNSSLSSTENFLRDIHMTYCNMVHLEPIELYSSIIY